MWTEEEIETISSDEEYIREVTQQQEDYHHETLQDKSERQLSWAKLISQDPELCAIYGLEK